MTRPVGVELSAVVVALEGAGRAMRPMVLTPAGPQGRDLPTTAFDPERQLTLHRTLAEWVTESTGVELDYIEQLYTFGDPRRSADLGPGEPHVVSIGYLALADRDAARASIDWTPWARWFPWEDRRAGAPPLLEEEILPRLVTWAGDEPRRAGRVAALFGTDGQPWRDELALERYELLYSARLVAEAWRDRGETPPADLPALGTPAPRDHRRILATAIGRLRGKLKYRPVLFELMGERFTLYELQCAAEAISGVALHKQNFRRMVMRSGMIEPTGTFSASHRGRPAAEYRFSAEAAWERRAMAVRFGGARRGR